MYRVPMMSEIQDHPQLDLQISSEVLLSNSVFKYIYKSNYCRNIYILFIFYLDYEVGFFFDSEEPSVFFLGWYGEVRKYKVCITRQSCYTKLGIFLVTLLQKTNNVKQQVQRSLFSANNQLSRSSRIRLLLSYFWSTCLTLNVKDFFNLRHSKIIILSRRFSKKNMIAMHLTNKKS